MTHEPHNPKLDERRSRGPNEPPSHTQVHTVLEGETLPSIAQRYFNDPEKWRAIYAANRDVLQDPDLVMAGQRLLIPEG